MTGFSMRTIGCAGGWTVIRGRNSKKSPATLEDWRCECGALKPLECPKLQANQREPQYGGDKQ